MTDTPAVTRLEPGQAGYPAALSRGGRSPVLSMLGNTALLDRPGLAFCGSRKASEAGIAMAADSAEQAVRAGLTVISGNAAGVDLAAHHAALRHSGSTILVLAEGIERFRIRREMRPAWDWSRALVISQFPPQAVWQAYRAMERNDVIIALSRAVIIVEAGDTGGTLAAGLRGLQVGKPVFVTDYEGAMTSAGGNTQLLGKGAVPLRRSAETGLPELNAISRLGDASRPVQGSLF
jgi:DNA processing protein